MWLWTHYSTNTHTYTGTQVLCLESAFISGINHMNQFDPLVWDCPLVHLHTPPLTKYTNYKLLSTTYR